MGLTITVYLINQRGVENNFLIAISQYGIWHHGTTNKNELNTRHCK
jgi:hypothetical protein